MPEWLLTVDGNILLWIQEFIRTAVVDSVVCFYTHLGDKGLLWLGLCALLLCFPKTRKAGLLGLASLALGFLCTNVIIKNLVGRPRPWLTVEGLVPLVNEPDPNSFPSGHTCSSFAAATVWVHSLPERWMWIVGLVLAALMGLSRLYVGVHFPSDVVVGGLIGFACGETVWLVWRKAREKRGLAV